MNFNMFNLLASSSPLPDWVTTLFPILQTVFVCLIAICAVGVIVLVFMQESNSGGLGSLGGATESNYYGQNKRDSKEYRLKKWTYILAGAILVFAVLYFISFNIVNIK